MAKDEKIDITIDKQIVIDALATIEGYIEVLESMGWKESRIKKYRLIYVSMGNALMRTESKIILTQ